MWATLRAAEHLRLRPTRRSLATDASSRRRSENRRSLASRRSPSSRRSEARRSVAGDSISDPWGMSYFQSGVTNPRGSTHGARVHSVCHKTIQSKGFRSALQSAERQLQGVALVRHLRLRGGPTGAPAIQGRVGNGVAHLVRLGVLERRGSMSPREGWPATMSVRPTIGRAHETARHNSARGNRSARSRGVVPSSARRRRPAGSRVPLSGPLRVRAVTVHTTPTRPRGWQPIEA